MGASLKNEGKLWSKKLGFVVKLLSLVIYYQKIDNLIKLELC